MNVDDVNVFYGTDAVAAERINVSPQAVSLWRKKGRIPLEQQIEWEIDSAGKLKANIPNQIRTGKYRRGTPVTA